MMNKNEKFEEIKNVFLQMGANIVMQGMERTMRVGFNGKTVLVVVDYNDGPDDFGGDQLAVIQNEKRAHELQQRMIHTPSLIS